MFSNALCATRRGRVDAVTALLPVLAATTDSDGLGVMLLHMLYIAARAGNVAILRAVLAHAPSLPRGAALRKAAKNGHAAAVWMLLWGYHRQQKLLADDKRADAADAAVCALNGGHPALAHAILRRGLAHPLTAVEVRVLLRAAVGAGDMPAVHLALACPSVYPHVHDALWSSGRDDDCAVAAAVALLAHPRVNATALAEGAARHGFMRVLVRVLDDARTDVAEIVHYTQWLRCHEQASLTVLLHPRLPADAICVGPLCDALRLRRFLTVRVALRLVPGLDPGADQSALLKAAATYNADAVVAQLLQDPRVDPMAAGAVECAVQHHQPKALAVLLADPRVDPSGDDNAALLTAVRGFSSSLAMLIDHPRVVAAGLHRAIGACRAQAYGGMYPPALPVLLQAERGARRRGWLCCAVIEE